MKRTLATGLMIAGLTIFPAVAQTSTDRSMSSDSTSKMSDTNPSTSPSGSTTSGSRSGAYGSGTDLSTVPPNEMSRMSPMDMETETDFDLGWLGLIGLAGLAGLARKRHDHHHHDHMGDHVHTDTRRI